MSAVQLMALKASSIVRIWKIVNEARCNVLDMLQRFSCRCWDSSQEGVAVVQVGDDRNLEQDLRCIFCEERPDPEEVAEGKDWATLMML